MTRSEYYAGTWDGICCTCGGNYFQTRGNTTCLSCNAQRQDEIAQGLVFEEDSVDEPPPRPVYTHTCSRCGNKTFGFSPRKPTPRCERCHAGWMVCDLIVDPSTETTVQAEREGGVE